MAKVRQDAWSHEDDLLLAETVLRHVREGSTQLNAFEEVGDKLNRTSAACGFRWNAEVRKKYDNAMDLAKRQRKERKRAVRKQMTQIKKSAPTISSTNDLQKIEDHENVDELTIDHIIQFLNQKKADFNMNNQSKITIDQTRNENNLLRSRVNELETELKKTEEKLATIQEDYQSFIQIMDRARKMTVLDDQSSIKAPTFRMDKNGNLEQVAEGYNSSY